MPHVFPRLVGGILPFGSFPISLLGSTNRVPRLGQETRLSNLKFFRRTEKLGRRTIAFLGTVSIRSTWKEVLEMMDRTTLFLATTAWRGMLKKRAHRLEPRLVTPISFDMLLS